ncbi:hypothetical protein CHARACLAT_028119, partial [Characodon lateralis]|nr:hypothetical protein [Characodon lateralis]
IDGTELANQEWIRHNAADGQCVTSLQNQEWRLVSCDLKNAWICEKKTVSVKKKLHLTWSSCGTFLEGDIGQAAAANDLMLTLYR